MAEKEKGKIIVVCGAKGGIGKTLTSVNLALALNKKNINVNILDADFQFGDVSLALDIQPAFTMRDIMGELSNIDQASMDTYLTEHSSGVHVLPSPERPEYAELITRDALLEVVEMLRNESDFLVVDTGGGIQERTVDLIEQADQILVVTTLEMTSLKSTKLMLETLEKLGLREKIRLVVNRYDMESLIAAEDVPEMLGYENIYYIPNNFQVASQSMNIGIPFVISRSRSNLSKAFFMIAESVLTNKPVSVDVKKKRTIRTRFKKR
ncbi:AAA family ATPase [Oceanobacillus halophilus]|uniref:MinD/ParA family protein n=1 Tax=Oceanobacillus halophilus TaxID=930130 RepID=A0A495A2V3_9BACI|nr:AAA family ATPase [Oceanobacillus halophilus]RKQ33256.1 MinD/ParA family protein [Oceanobacillus halophilus]